MEKKYKKGEMFESEDEFAKWVADKKPYYSGGESVLRNIELCISSGYYWSAPRQYLIYHKAIEIQEPEKLGRLYMHRSTKEIEVKKGADVSRWQPVTIDDAGTVWSCDE